MLKILHICLLVSFMGCIYATNNVINLRLSSKLDTSVIPNLLGSGEQCKAVLNLFEGLMTLDRNNQPMLGVAYKIAYDIHKRKAVFYLKSNVLWTDGMPVTAYDFEYAIKNAVRSINNYTPAAVNLLYIKNAIEVINGKINTSKLGIKALDNTTLEIHTIGNPHELETLTTSCAYLPFPSHKPLFEYTNGIKQYNLDVSNGPFRIQRFERSSITMAYNKMYTGKPPRIKSIRYSIIANETVAASLFLHKKIDLLTLNKPYSFISSTLKQQGNTNSNVFLYMQPNKINNKTRTVINFLIHKGKLLDKSNIYGTKAFRYMPVSPGTRGIKNNLTMVHNLASDSRTSIAKKIMKSQHYGTYNLAKVSICGPETQRNLMLNIREMLRAGWIDLAIDQCNTSGKVTSDVVLLEFRSNSLSVVPFMLNIRMLSDNIMGLGLSNKYALGLSKVALETYNKSNTPFLMQYAENTLLDEIILLPLYRPLVYIAKQNYIKGAVKQTPLLIKWLFKLNNVNKVNIAS